MGSAGMGPSGATGISLLEATVPRIICFPKHCGGSVWAELPTFPSPRKTLFCWYLPAFMNCVFNTAPEYLPHKFLRSDLWMSYY